MNAYLAVIIENVLPVLTMLLVAVISVFATWALKKLKDKLGVDISAQHQALLTKAIEDGIGLAEQWALTKVKRGEAAPAGAEKLDKALEFVTATAKDLKLDEKAKDVLVKLIEARLGVAALTKE